MILASQNTLKNENAIRVSVQRGQNNPLKLIHATNES